MRRLTTRQVVISVVISVVLFVLVFFWDDMAPLVRAALVGAGAFGALAYVLSRPPRGGAPAPDPLLAFVEQVVSDETRRPWNPTTLPWLPTEAGPMPVLLVPAADYHLAEIAPLAQELEKQDIPTKIAIGESPWGRTWQGLHWYPELAMHELPEPEQVASDTSLVVTMKDTGSMTDWVTDVRALGVPVVGKVEGAQDFWDSDTPDERRPYRNLDLVLCQGRFDADALADRETVIVGSTRLERLWWAPPAAPREPLAVINLNFVYGVRTADRDLWLETAVAGCETAGVPYVVSVHPAERSRLRTSRVTRISASRLLPHASVLISRFSTLPFEAMARGVPFIYHNPHGEAVKTFSDPMGAFEATDSTETMKAMVSRIADRRMEKERTRTRLWFCDHVSVDPSERSETRSARVLASLL